MSAVIVNGQKLTTLPSGALWWQDREILIVADLHLEKGSSLARHGSMLPPYDSADTLHRLAAEMSRVKPRQVIALGDSFHDHDGPARLSAPDKGTLGELVGSTDWLWITGNHDPAPHGPWGGSIVEEIVIGGLAFRHNAEDGNGVGEISGHFHPKAAVMTRTRRYTARCFVSDGRRLIVPAFGSYTGGLDVFDPAITRLLAPDFWAYLTAPGRVLAVPRHRLVPARA